MVCLYPNGNYFLMFKQKKNGVVSPLSSIKDKSFRIGKKSLSDFEEVEPIFDEFITNSKRSDKRIRRPPIPFRIG